MVIDSEFKAHIPSLKDDERAVLEQSILADGCRDPLVVWDETDVLLDGHNRLEICERLDIDCHVARISLPDRDAALAWIEDNQLGRRNLTDKQFKYYLGRKYQRAKRQGARTDLTSGQSDQRSDTAARIAAEHGTSERTVRRAGEFSSDLDEVTRVAGEPFKEAILSGKSKATTQELRDYADVARDEGDGLTFASEKDAEQWLKERRRERHEQRAEARERELSAQTRKTATAPTTIDRADAFDVHRNFAERSIDLLITDPPYSTNVDDVGSFSHWLDLWLPKVADSGRAYVFIGAYPDELRAYLNRAAGQERMALDNVLVWTYRNTIGPSPKVSYKLNWQACLYFYGPDAPPLNCPVMNEQFTVQDVNAPDARTGVRLHAWQKPDELAERLIRHATTENSLVVDPFCGTGSFVSAASRLGRRAIGYDMSDEMLEICRRRGLEVDDAA